MAEPIVLALDAHGGDFGAEVMVPAALDALVAEPRLQLLLAGIPDQLHPLLESIPADQRVRLRVVAAEHVLDPAARPVAVLRRGAGSSLSVALEQVASGAAQACVSAGATGAIMTLAAKHLGMLPGVHRPALMSSIPLADGMVGMLDLGANLGVTALQLQQFAVMGSVALAGNEGLPSVGLLNVGHEDTKGLPELREAHEALLAGPLNYQGFIEGHDIFAGKVDLVVCDGFTGNTVLKASEGLAAMLFGEIRNTLQGSWRSRLGAVLARPALAGMLERLDPAKHNGAPLLGLDGVVVKSHGRAGRYATVQALLEACREVQRRVPERITKLLLACGLEKEA
jgi:glycerol-3-phosphate acyltransferase PlsX